MVRRKTSRARGCAAHGLFRADRARDDQYGQPIVTNGLPLSKLHHAAFDSHLIGVSPDYRVIVSERLLELRDGPTLEALKGLHNKTINLPRRTQDLPDRDRLARRFELFRSVT